MLGMPTGKIKFLTWSRKIVSHPAAEKPTLVIILSFNPTSPQKAEHLPVRSHIKSFKKKISKILLKAKSKVFTDGRENNFWKCMMNTQNQGSVTRKGQDTEGY